MNQGPQELVSGFFDRAWNHGYLDEPSPDVVLDALWHNEGLGRPVDASHPAYA